MTNLWTGVLGEGEETGGISSITEVGLPVFVLSLFGRGVILAYIRKGRLGSIFYRDPRGDSPRASNPGAWLLNIQLQNLALYYNAWSV